MLFRARAPRLRGRQPPALRAATGSAPGQDQTAVRTNGMRRLTRYGVIIAAGMLAAGCSAGSGSSSSAGSGTSGKTTTNSVLTISNENGALWTCGFNPLNASDTLLSVGFMYEPV